MAASKLKLVGRYRTWRPGVREGRLQNADGTQHRVLIRPLPGIPAKDDILQALRQEAKLLAGIQHQDVLRVEHVTAFGGKAALVVEAIDAIDLSHVMRLLDDRHQVIPLRAAVEIVAIVAAAVDAATAPVPGSGEASVVHPGPVPGEILIDSLGRVKLAGFRVMTTGQPPPACPEGYAPPEGLDPNRPTAYGLGALLVELLTGAPPPPPAQDEQSHERILRRTTTRIAAKVGQAGWEDLVRIVRATLAFTPQARLGPADFARELRAHALDQRSPRLRTWAPAAIPGLRKQLDPSAPGGGLDDPSQPPLPPDPLEDRPTVVGGGTPEQLASLEASFGPARQLGFDDPSEEMATEVVSADLLARIRAMPLGDTDGLEKTLPANSPVAQSAVEPNLGPPPSIAPPPSLPPLDDAPVASAFRPMDDPRVSAPVRPLDDSAILPPLPPLQVPDDAPTVKWTVGDLADAGFEPPSPTEDSVPLATEEAPTAEHADGSEQAATAGPSTPIDPGAIAPSDHSDDEEPVPERRRRRAWLLLLPLAAALLFGAWTAWYFLPGLIGSLTGPTREQLSDPLLGDLLDPPAELPTAPPPPTEPAAPTEQPDDSPLAQHQPLDPGLPDRTTSGPVPGEQPLDAPDMATTAEDDPQGSAREQAIAALRAEPPAPPQPDEPDEPPAEVQPQPSPTAEPEPDEPKPDPAGDDEPDGDAVAAAPPTGQPDPDEVEPEPAAPPDEPTAAGLFRVEFLTAHPDIFELEVKCHQGSAKGPPPVILNDAGKGPCRVTAFTNNSGRMIAWIGLTGPATLTCFEGGQRACN